MSGRIISHLPSLETPRLLVRELRAADVHDFAAYMLMPQYQRHMAVTHRNVEHLRNSVLRAIGRQDQEARRMFLLAGELKSRRVVIADGFASCGDSGLVEIGWGVNPLYWRHGIGAELAKALLALSFERLLAERVWCKVMAPNVASLRLARRAGFKPWRSHSEYPVGRNRIEAVEMFVMTADEYFEAPY